MRLTALGLAAALALASGCSTIVENHGYAPSPEDLATIAIGQDTKGSVTRKVGRPSTTGIFTADGWYYVATEVETYLFYEPRVSSRRVVAIRFDRNDVVSAVNEYGLDDGRVIDLATQTTPTLGRELNVLQQLLGNIGTIRAEDITGDE